MTYMTKAQLRQHLLSAPPGTSPGGIISALRAKGVVMEGDPTPASTSGPNSFSQNYNIDAQAIKDKVAQPNPADGSFIGNTFRGAQREMAGGLSAIGDRLAHPSKLIGDVKDTISLGANAAVGAVEGVVQGVTGKQMPQYHPDGTVTYPAEGTVPEQTTKALLDTAAGAIRHPIKTVENHPIATAMVVIPALRALATRTNAIEKTTVLAKQTKQYMSEKANQLGIIDPNAAALQSKAAMQELEPVIQRGIEKGIRPSVMSKQTIGQVDKYYEDASKAVHTIVANKDSLQLLDVDGFPSRSNLPQNLKHFSDAVDQTKKLVFNQYDDLQKQAGLAGATVNTKSVADDLVTAMSDPKFAAIEDQNPGIADYILQRATALEKRGSYTTEQAQIAIKNYNDSLAAFYKNPSMDTFQKANVDAMIANRLREGLDSSIMDATGEAYAPLKQQYGALKAVEKDVLNAAMRDARKNAKGLIDFSDIFSGGDLVNGLISHNPALFAKGSAQIAIKQYLKFLNDPNNIVKNMFEKVNSVVSSPR